MTRILFVCLGNICRSPAAEGVLRNMADKAGIALTIDSAGTGDWHIGNPPYAPMQEAAQARGLDLSDLRARQFGSTDFAAFDLIIAMDPQNLADIEAQRPDGAQTPVRLMTSYGPDKALETVPDPYFTRDFEGALDLIELCAEGLVQNLRNPA